MTKREMLEAVVNGVEVTADMKEFAQNELIKMDAAAAKRKATMSKKQEENEKLKSEILTHLGMEARTATDIAGVMEMSVQKASALLRQIVKDGKATQTEVAVKGKGKQKGYVKDFTE